MLSKWQKFMMYLIGLVAMLLSLVVIVPYRAFWPNEGLYSLEVLIKLIILPLMVLLLSLYPNILKYRQVASYREQSKIVSFTSYFPLASYLIALLVYGLYTLGKSMNPFLEVGLGMGFYSLWLVIMVVTILLILIGFSVFNRLEMRLNVKEHIILDICLIVIMFFFALLINKISQIYRGYFELYVPRTGEMGEIELLFIFIIYAILFIIGVKRLYYFVIADEVNLVIKMDDDNKQSQLAYDVEYKRAYKNIIERFEDYLADNMNDIKFFDEELIDDGPLFSTDAANKVEATDVITELVEEEPPVTEVVDTKPVVIEVVEEVIVPVDESKRAELEAKRLELKYVQDVLNKQNEQIKSFETALASAKQPVVKELVPEQKDNHEKEILKIKPSFKVLTNYAKSIPGITVVENEDKTMMRFMVGKKLFLIANQTDRDYRLTFMYDLQEVVSLMIKYAVVVKAKTPKGPNWFRLVNKGEFKEEDLYDIVDKAHSTLLSLEERKELEKKASRSKPRQ